VDLLICTSIGVIDKKTILSAIRNAANHSIANPNGVKNLCVSYIGHGKKNHGDWCFSNGSISLQEILQLFRPEEEFRLLVLSDCCFSGKWAVNLRKYRRTK